MREEELREVARRAARQALEESGARKRASADLAPLLRERGAASLERERSGGPRRGRELVTAACLSETADRGALVVPDGAVITPLAHEEAQRRGIHFVHRHASPIRSVAVGCDHAGFALKGEVLAWLRELGRTVLDCGARDERPSDYPVSAQAVADAVASGACELGIAIDATGVGSAIAANKVPGVRAAACADPELARSARQHSHANVLALGARSLAPAQAFEIVRAFLAGEPGEERHARRVAKIEALERRHAPGPGAGPRRGA